MSPVVWTDFCSSRAENNADGADNMGRSNKGLQKAEKRIGSDASITHNNLSHIIITDH